MRTDDDEGTADPIAEDGPARRRRGHLAGRQLRPNVPPPRIQRGRVGPDRVGRGECPHRRPPAAHQLPVRPARRRRRHVRAGQRGRAVVGRLRGQGTRPEGGRPARPLHGLGTSRRCSRRSARPSSGACGCRRTWWGPPPTADIPLPPTVRRYYFPGTTHGGGRGGFCARSSGVGQRCELAENPNPQTETMRALTRRPDGLGGRRDAAAAEPLPENRRRDAGGRHACGDRVPDDSRRRFRRRERVARATTSARR